MIYFQVILHVKYILIFFVAVICGWPGSGIYNLLYKKGKTTLLKFILNNNKLLFKKFDEILIFSRKLLIFNFIASITEFKNLLLPKNNMCNTLDWNFLYARLEQINLTNKGYINVLIIIDDFISEYFIILKKRLNKEKFSKNIYKLVFNRRHLIDKGMISIFLTSQKYSMIRKIYFF